MITAARPTLMALQRLTPESSDRFREGIRLFNREEFFACHEALEAVWLEADGPDKTFLQGLIQVAVAYHHLRRGNAAGAVRLLRAGIEKLSARSSYRRRIDAEALRALLEPLPGLIEAGQAGPQTPAPQIRLLPAGESFLENGFPLSPDDR
ncbi:MAG TPA: DUF309 domain-containing protein [Terriglobia bacterium]|nr:DUF309 domain-containing protein [Terriglobia bacterium]